MPTPTRKGIFFVLLAMVLVVGVAVVPDIISEDLRAWCLSTFGEGYQGYLLGFFVVGSVVLLFLTTDIAQHLRPGATPSKPDRYNIPPGAATRKQINLARTAISQAEPEQALRHLSDLKVPALEAEIDMLSSRLVEYQRTKRYGVDAPDEENREFNRISRDIRDLITTLEKELATGTENYQIIKDYLKKRYTNRLEQKLAKRQPVNLRRIPSTEGTSEERAAAFIAYNSDEVAGTMAQAFRDARGRLLLIGAPGAGKTTLMLQLVLDLLDSEPDALPVLLNLATWSSEYITLEAWLKKILPAELGVSEKYAQEVIQRGQLILLLDGFDEIRERDRASCLEAIGRYGEDGRQQYVISSRIYEYRNVLKDAPVYWQIEVGPLSFEQVEAELERLWGKDDHPEPEAQAMLQAIRKNKLLYEAAHTPFYFNTLQILFSGGKILSDLKFTSDTVEGLQMEITDRFVEYELKVPFTHECRPEQADYWLSFLASRMSDRNMIIFELRDLQYNWWNFSKGQQVLARFVTQLEISLKQGLTLGLAISLLSAVCVAIGGAYAIRQQVTHDVEMVFGIIFGFVTGFIFGLVIGLVIGCFIGLVSALVSGLVTTLIFELSDWLRASQKSWEPRIKTISSIDLSWGNFKKHIIRKLKITLLGLFGLLTIIGVFNLYDLNGLFLILLWLTIVLGSVIYNLLENGTDIIFSKSPYHRFIASIKVFHFSILEHLLLRYQFYKKDLLPLRLVTFLNELSARHLLETDGATWRFRHGILQDFFTAKYYVYNPSLDVLEELVKEHLYDSYRWSNVFYIVSRLLPNSDDLLKLMLKKNRELLYDPLMNNLVNLADKALLPSKSKFSHGSRKSTFISISLFFGFGQDREPDLNREFDFFVYRSTQCASNLVYVLDHDSVSEISQDMDKNDDLVAYLISLFSIDQDICNTMDLKEGNEQNIKFIRMINNFLEGNILIAECLNSATNLSKSTREYVLKMMFEPLTEEEKNAMQP